MTTTQRRTKIVSTLGPSTDKPGVLESIIEAGVNVVRLNFSHGSPEGHTADSYTHFTQPTKRKG